MPKTTIIFVKIISYCELTFIRNNYNQRRLLLAAKIPNEKYKMVYRSLKKCQVWVYCSLEYICELISKILCISVGGTIIAHFLIVIFLYTNFNLQWLTKTKKNISHVTNSQHSRKLLEKQ